MNGRHLGRMMRPALVAAAGALALASGLRAAQEAPLRGVLHVVWDAEPTALVPSTARFYLVQDDGRTVEILPEGAGPASVESLEGSARRRVEVIGEPVAVGAGATPVMRARSVSDLGEVPRAARAASVAARDFVTILCRFADDDSTPFTRAQVEAVHGSAYPGVQQFYAELSGDPGIMSGSLVTDWYTLPRPRSAYVEGDHTDHGAVARDCTAAADDDVDFSGFYGINLQLNGALSTRPTPPYDVLSFGGSWTMEVDGAFRVFGATWLSGAHHANYVVVQHEIGHAFGWPHSSGDYGEEYDSRWDVMSAGYLRQEEPWGWLTIHTIAHHKNAAGWIPDERRWHVPEGSRATAEIVRSALPPASGRLMAEVPLADGGSYTVETRLFAGHDRPLPAQAVVIHRTRGTRAYVVDPDLNGFPNDEGAIWRPGETFVDAEREIRITIGEATEDGFMVTIDHASGAECAVGIQASPASGGAVAVTDGGETGDCGRTVRVAATPNDGWVFLHWTEGETEVGIEAELETPLPANRTLVARFVRADDLAARAIAALFTGDETLEDSERALLDRAGNANATLDVGDVLAFLDEHEGAAAGGRR